MLAYYLFIPFNDAPGRDSGEILAHVHLFQCRKGGLPYRKHHLLYPWPQAVASPSDAESELKVSSSTWTSSILLRIEPPVVFLGRCLLSLSEVGSTYSLKDESHVDFTCLQDFIIEIFTLVLQCLVNVNKNHFKTLADIIFIILLTVLL